MYLKVIFVEKVYLLTKNMTDSLRCAFSVIVTSRSELINPDMARQKQMYFCEQWLDACENDWTVFQVFKSTLKTFLFSRAFSSSSAH